MMFQFYELFWQSIAKFWQGKIRPDGHFRNSITSALIDLGIFEMSIITK